MNRQMKQTFLDAWSGYFGEADLPLAWQFADDPLGAEIVAPKEGKWRCLICDLARVRQGQGLAFTRESIGCGGGRFYAGFEKQLRPGIEHFLSCGIPGEMEGERYKKTPELAAAAVASMPGIRAEGKYLVFKRWDGLGEFDEPQAVVFFATPDVLSGLFTLANFDAEENNVIAPFSSGCGAILTHPLAERNARRPRAFLGMFDVSARPCVPPGTLSFSVPMTRFARMVENMEESFLGTDSWKKVRERIQRQVGAGKSNDT